MSKRNPSENILDDEQGWKRAPVIRQAERELLLLVEFCAPSRSRNRLTSLVAALVGFADMYFAKPAERKRRKRARR